MSSNEAHNEYYENQGVYHAADKISSQVSPALFISATGFRTPISAATAANWALYIRCVKKITGKNLFVRCGILTRQKDTSYKIRCKILILNRYCNTCNPVYINYE